MAAMHAMPAPNEDYILVPHLKKVERRDGLPAIAKLAVVVTAGAAALGACIVLAPAGRDGHPNLPQASIRSSAKLFETAAATDPNWGCGLVGAIPGISRSGEVQAETQRLIDGIRHSSTFGKVSYWNWNLAPMTTQNFTQVLSADFLFMPEQWGATAPDASYVRPAGKAGFLDSDGVVSPSTMADVFLGTNEPDIAGSCMGNMFGECQMSCDQESIDRGDCPIARLDGPQLHANAKGQCNCWQFAQATGAGFWPLKHCAGPQPLPNMWSDPECVEVVMSDWQETARIARSKGYKYLTTPLIAAHMDYAKNFLEKACQNCTDISCGCPVYVAFHFYAYDCQPETLGGYTNFQKRLDAVAEIMEQHPFVKGAIINEVGMLNCDGGNDNPICVPNSGEYPAANETDHRCPATEELPKGLATYLEKLFDMIIAAKTKDGRPVVKGFSWFNENMAGGTYDLRLFDEDGSINPVGEAYIDGCARWANAQKAAASEVDTQTTATSEAPEAWGTAIKST